MELKVRCAGWAFELTIDRWILIFLVGGGGALEIILRHIGAA
jgi:hypothetical protein